MSRSAIEYAPYTEGYFVSEETKDALVGRLIRERKTALELRGRLGVESKRLGDEYEELAQILQGNPANLFFTDEPSQPGQFQQIVDVSIFDAQRIRGLAQQSREAIRKIDDLEKQLKELGYDQAAFR